MVQPFETGVVRAIHVQDGQRVKAGDVLIELDPTVNAAERDHLHDDLVGRTAQRRAAARGACDSDDRAADFVPPADADPVLVATQRQLLANQVSEHRAKLAALDAPAGAEGGRARDDRGHDPQARSADPRASSSGSTSARR